jgi:hypothetical protein
LRQRGIFSIGFGTVATAWYFFLLVLELLRQRGIFCIFLLVLDLATARYFSYFFYWFWNCCDSVVFFVFFSMGFGTVATAWYVLHFFYWLCNCCDSVVFFLLVLELLRQRGIFFYWFWNCCDSVVFFVFFSIGFGTVATG